MTLREEFRILYKIFDRIVQDQRAIVLKTLPRELYYATESHVHMINVTGVKLEGESYFSLMRSGTVSMGVIRDILKFILHPVFGMTFVEGYYEHDYINTPMLNDNRACSCSLDELHSSFEEARRAQQRKAYEWHDQERRIEMMRLQQLYEDPYPQGSWFINQNR